MINKEFVKKFVPSLCFVRLFPMTDLVNTVYSNNVNNY